MRAKIVAGNWKLNGTKASVSALLDELTTHLNVDNEATCIVFPPDVFMPMSQDMLSDSGLCWGGQDCYVANQGAFTGETSLAMLKEFGASHCLVGHSERRSLFHESEDFVAQKFHHVKENGMIPVLCVGETLSERQNGLTEAVIKRQLEAVAKRGSVSGAVLAYEPVWAIGTGETATPAQAQGVHQFIRAYLNEVMEDAHDVSLLYGGSVNENNARALFAMPDIDGGLVGGASLSAEKFLEIVKCIN